MRVQIVPLFVAGAVLVGCSTTAEEETTGFDVGTEGGGTRGTTTATGTGAEGAAEGTGADADAGTSGSGGSGSGTAAPTTTTGGETGADAGTSDAGTDSTGDDGTGTTGDDDTGTGTTGNTDECRELYDNCDGDPGTGIGGCETLLFNNPAHCGACDKTCGMVGAVQSTCMENGCRVSLSFDVIDTSLIGDQPNVACGNAAAGCNDRINVDGSPVMYGLVRPKDWMAGLPDPLPAGATVVSATLTLYAFEHGGGNFDMFEITEAWDEQTLTYASAHPAHTPALGVGVITGTGFQNLDITTLAQKWIDTAAADPHGVWLQKGSDSITKCASADHPTADWHPKITVELSF